MAVLYDFESDWVPEWGKGECVTVFTDTERMKLANKLHHRMNALFHASNQRSIAAKKAAATMKKRRESEAVVASLEAKR